MKLTMLFRYQEKGEWKTHIEEFAICKMAGSMLSDRLVVQCRKGVFVESLRSIYENENTVYVKLFNEEQVKPCSKWLVLNDISLDNTYTWLTFVFSKQTEQVPLLKERAKVVFEKMDEQLRVLDAIIEKMKE